MMNTVTVTAQIIGFIALICSLLSFQQKTRKRIMVFQMTASLLFSAQLFMLGAITGGCLDLISFTRSLIFSKNDKKWASSPVWFGVFVGVMIITGILTWESAWSLLPIAGTILSTVALWMKSEKRIRVISLFVGPCWMVYNIVNGAYTGALNELLAMVSIIIALVRHDVGKFDKKANTKNRAEVSG